MSVLRTRAHGEHEAWSLADVVGVPLGEADLVVVSQYSSGAGTHTTDGAADRGRLEGNTIRAAGLVADDEPWHILVCV